MAFINIFGFIVQRPTLTFGSWIVIMSVFAYGFTKIETRVQLLKLLDEDTDLIHDYAWLEENIGNLVPMEVVITVPPERCRTAEEHAEEDKQKARLAEVRNKTESLCFQTEKLIKENDEKLSGSDKAPIEAAIAKAREAAKGDDVDSIQSAHDALEQATHALSKVLYEQQAPQAGGEAPDGQAAEGDKSGDDTIDAEFEVKQDS